MMYARLADILGTMIHRLKTLLPHVSNPDNLTTTDLEAIHGIVKVERVYAPIEWYQTRGEPVVDTAVRPVTITYPAVDLPLAEAKARAAQRINQQRDEAFEAGFEFPAAGSEFPAVRYQSRQTDRENIAGAVQLATLAVMNGAQPGNMHWHGGEQSFVWITEANELTPMDAQTMIAFGQTAAAHKHALIFSARAKKDAVTAATTLAEVIGAVG